jgi:hypothetical protein
MIDYHVKWLVNQEAIKKVRGEYLGQEKIERNMTENGHYLCQKLTKDKSLNTLFLGQGPASGNS